MSAHEKLQFRMAPVGVTETVILSEGAKMSRRLILDLMRAKKLLRREEAALHEQELSAEAKYQFAVDEQVNEKRNALLQLAKKQSDNQLKQRRAHVFGLRLAKLETPYCVECFIERAVARPMKKDGNGAMRFRCKKCGHELKV